MLNIVKLPEGNIFTGLEDRMEKVGNVIRIAWKI